MPSQITVTVIGEPRVMDLLHKFKSFTSTPSFRREKKNANTRIRRYWEKNIYKVYNRRKGLGLPVSGALGKALTINSRDIENVQFGYKKLSRSKSGISGGPAYNYSKAVLEGTYYGGRGVYSRKRDKKIMVDSGYHTPGVSYAKYGIEWNFRFSKAILINYRKAVENTIKEITK